LRNNVGLVLKNIYSDTWCQSFKRKYCMTRELCVKVFGKTQLPESNIVITYQLCVWISVFKRSGAALLDLF
jgi:hypothetical protein